MNKKNKLDVIIDELLEGGCPDAEEVREVRDTWEEMREALKRINHAFYVEGTAKALKPIMAETKAIILRAEGK